MPLLDDLRLIAIRLVRKLASAPPALAAPRDLTDVALQRSARDPLWHPVGVQARVDRLLAPAAATRCRIVGIIDRPSTQDDVAWVEVDWSDGARSGRCMLRLVRGLEGDWLVGRRFDEDQVQRGRRLLAREQEHNR